jgi:hypothetical protein
MFRCQPRDLESIRGLMGDRQGQRERKAAVPGARLHAENDSLGIVRAHPLGGRGRSGRR